MKRLLIISLRGVDPHPSRCGIYEFEDVVGQLEDADFCIPQLMEGRIPGRLLHVAQRVLERTAGLTLTRADRLVSPDVRGSYELGLFSCQTLSDLKLLQSIPRWRRCCRQMICCIDDLWLHNIEEYPRALNPLRSFDFVVSTTRHPVEQLTRSIGRPCFAVPEGVDCFRFCPYPNPPRRSIDVFSLGRRGPVTHQALAALSRKGQIYYLYDSMRSNVTIDIHDHRDLIANHIKRARYFLVQPAKANPPDKSRGQEEVGNRYFEGCAGGAILIGETPRSPTAAEYFNWPDAILGHPYNSATIGEFLTELDAQPERRAAIHRRNAIESLRQHDWCYRWQSMLNLMEIQPSPSLAARQQQLRTLAESIEASDETTHLPQESGAPPTSRRD